jgi:FkbM family methyltransferase
VRSPRWEFAWFEARYSFSNWWHSVRNASATEAVVYNGPALVRTVMGDYEVRRGTQDAALISPAFERGDWNELRRVLRKASGAGREIWFLDVGANIGTFIVRILKLYPDVKAWAFEPAPDNVRMLERNIALNARDASRARVFPVAVSDRAGEAPLFYSSLVSGVSHLESAPSADTIRVQTRRLDAMVESPSGRTTIVAKLDVEGHEQNVLDGMTGLLAGGAECWMWIEDIFHTEALYAKLRSMGFRFERKITPYNSWWLRPGKQH